MRKHLSWYTVGMPHSAHFRQTINTMEKMEELIRGVNEIFPDEVWKTAEENESYVK